MSLVPEMFEPDEYVEEVPDWTLRHLPETVSQDRCTAKIHAFTLLKHLPPGMCSVVQRHLKWIKGGVAQKALKRDAESVPP